MSGVTANKGTRAFTLSGVVPSGFSPAKKKDKFQLPDVPPPADVGKFRGLGSRVSPIASVRGVLLGAAAGTMMAVSSNAAADIVPFVEADLGMMTRTLGAGLTYRRYAQYSVLVTRGELTPMETCTSSRFPSDERVCRDGESFYTNSLAFDASMPNFLFFRHEIFFQPGEEKATGHRTTLGWNGPSGDNYHLRFLGAYSEHSSIKEQSLQQKSGHLDFGVSGILQFWKK